MLTAAGAFADAGNPISGTIKANTVDNGDGTLTVYVRGQWNWLSHTTDCNTDRAAVGLGVVWNDTTEPGYTVTNGAISAGVGVSSLRAGDSVNKVDQMVHPADRGNQVEGYTVAGTDYPASQQFADPSPPGITATQVAAWKGGCGRLPQSATASKGSNTERTGLTCANGTSDCAGHPWGSWGYEKANGAGKPFGYSHTYLKSALPSKVCVNFYDVHGGGNVGSSNFQVPNATKTINVDGDSGGENDNSIQTNAYDTTNGANCVSLVNTTTTTNIHNASHSVVTVVEAGTTVHDSVTVAAPAGNPTPGGNVTLDWFTNNTCTGTPASTSSQLALASGQVDATSFAKGPLAPGLYGFKAHYLGDGGLNLASDGACEPLRVVDAKIAISPGTATNHIGDPHVFTAHVEVNDGTGWTNAPSGTSINFLKSGPGSFSTANPCTTSGSTGSCTITLTSSTTGVSTVSASTSLLVSGFSLTRSTDGTGSNSGLATKRWVNAKISISPSATNRAGDPHTFTVTLWKDTGDGNGFVKAAGEHVGFTLTDSNGANHSAATGTCASAGANTDADGACTITFVSGTTGKVTAHASASLSIAGSSPFTVATGGGAPNGADSVKTFVDGKITIAIDATHEVDNTHTFVVTLWQDLGDGNGFVPAPGQHVDYALTDILGGNGVLDAAASTCDDSGPNTDAGGHCLIVVTSATPGQVIADATSSLTVGGVPITVATNGIAPNSADAHATFVDANIQISPQTATNPLSTNHTLTGHVNVNDGSGGGFVNAPDGTVIDFSLVSGPGSFSGPSSCTTSGGTGSCSVDITSSTVGTTSVKASTTLAVGAVALHRETGDANAGDSPNATKHWAAARISIAPDATNEVGDPHTFTVTLQKDPGTGTFVPAAGEQVVVTLTDSNGASHTAPASTCATTDANGKCTITFTSPSAGKVTAHASASLNIGGATVTANTSGADAVKTFVDASIQIDPLSATNRIGQTHTFTAHVTADGGTGSAAAAGALVTFTIDSGPGTLSNGNVSSTSCSTNAAGDCTIDLVSGTTGVTTVSAHTALTLGGVHMRRSTDGTRANSGPAVKTWANARISVAPDATNEVGQPHTFTVTLEKDPGTGTYVPAAGEHVSFTLTDSNGAAHAAPASTCATTDANGRCTITFSSPTAGKVDAHASATLSVAGSAPFSIETNGSAPNGGDAVKTYVDANVQITPATATNPLSTKHTLTGHVNVNDGSGGFANAPDGTTIHFSLPSGPGSFAGPDSCTTAGGSGSCSVDITSATAGTTTIRAATDVTVGGLVLHRETGDAKAGDGADATKHWAVARIVIATDATHEVDGSHTYIVTLEKDPGTGTFVPAAGEHVDVTLTDANGASHTSPLTTCATTDVNGQCTITLTSDTPGKVTAHASATLTIDGATIPVETAIDAVATFVDANIQIDPQSAVNPIGTTHTLTGHVNVNGGSGTGYANAPDGTVIQFTLASGPGTFVRQSSCTTSGGTGSCTAVITSATTGVTTIRAATDVSVAGVSLHRESGDGQAGDSTDATKRWAGAKISIAPSGTHEVGTSHTFTVTLMKDTSTGTFVPAAGEQVDVTLADAGGASHTAVSSTCGTTDANGQCTITTSSSTPGTVTAHASATLSVLGISLAVQTNGLSPNSGDAVATFVDANVQVTPPSAINPIGTTHTLTGHVNVNAGSGGYANAPAGTTISFTLAGPATFVGPSSCTTSGSTGSCTVVISSTTTGTSTIKAATDATVGGVTLHRATGDRKTGDGADASKLWADDSARTDVMTSGSSVASTSAAVVTTVVSGTVIHDKVFAARTASTPAGVPDATGSVIFHRYSTIDCSGASVDQTVALTPGSPSTAISADFAPTADMSFRVEYLGDANYPARFADCEPLTVTPRPAPGISIVKNPKNQAIAVGGTATFNITVTNSGNTVLTDVHVDDPLTASCDRTKAQLPELASMAPGDTVSYTCTQRNVRASFDNVATATGTPPSASNVTATDTAPVKVRALAPPKRRVKTKKPPHVVSHKKPKTTG